MFNNFSLWICRMFSLMCSSVQQVWRENLDNIFKENAYKCFKYFVMF